MDGAVRLRRWIERKDMTQAGLARIVGVSRCYVNQWCSGSRRPGLDHALLIQELTRIPVSAWQKRSVQ